MSTEDIIEDVAEAEATDTVSSKDEAANKQVRNYAMGAGAIGLVPLPLIDLAALSALQLKMLHSLSKIYGVEFKPSLGKASVSSLLGGVTSLTMAAPLAASLSKFIPVIGQTLSMGSLAVTSSATTYAVGQVFKQHFASGGTFLTFDPEKVRDYFEEQLEKGKDLANSMTKDKGTSAVSKTAKVI